MREVILHMKVVITGDSLSYNRYDYEPLPQANAYDCPPDMGSWSFQLRDWLITRDRRFVYGADIIGGGTEAPNRVFGDKSYTGNSTVDFTVNANTLYCQKHPDGGIYELYADNKPVAELDFKGNPTYFRGMELFRADIPRALKYTLKGNGLFTLNGAGSRGVDVFLTGQGSRTAEFFNINFYERIGRFSPDVLVMIIGANDAVYSSAESFAVNIESVLRKIAAVNPGCKIYLLTSTKNADASQLIKINTELKKAAEKYNCVFVDLFELFEGVPCEQWRYDNIHLNKYGNNILFKKIKEIMSDL